MELRHLRYFVVVAEEMHITRAAARLGIAQPSLTQQMKALERELGARLFEKSGRGIALTNAGATFVEDARVLLAQAHGAVRRAKDASAGLLGRLNVGFTESASFHPLVTEAFQIFRAAYPAVALDLREGHSPNLIAALIDGSLDLAFIRPPFPSDAKLESQFLAEEEMLAVMPRDHPLASRERIRLLELANERFVLYPRVVRPGLADIVIEACRSAGFQPQIVQKTPQLSSTINLVAAGMGISVVPAGLREVRSSAVRYLPIEDLSIKAQLGLLGRKADPSPLVRNFRGTLNGLAGALSG
jgi:DNA-binding transcriptional LysR family regulator